ncbi:MAG: restriction endonuclease [Puniceicoccaceae bacterium]|nr:restriction endonuclease [Puniceicoccaceae bacterium]|tara:strand:- start:10455 stop:11684 length:1230 start_codon:yes stop_codon:yes gene_type:complete
MSAIEGWQTHTLEECCDILDNKRIPINGEERESRIGTVPYYGANGLQGYIDGFIFDEPLILIAEDGGVFDEYATRPIAYKISGKSWVNNHAHVLRAKASFDQDLIFYNLEHKDIQSYIVGGTRSKLNQGALRQIEINLPESLPEQAKIAEVLSTVDRAIAQTEALITKQQRIKTGLMADLLTRGIDADGNLRSEATHAFKDSPLGRIPVEWEVKDLKSVGNWYSGGTPSRSNSENWGNEVPWVCPKDMKVFDLKTTIEKLTALGLKRGSRLLPAEAIFIVVRGMILAHTFPVCITNKPMALNQDVKGIVTDPNVCSRFFAYWLSEHGQSLLKITTTATHGTKRFDMGELHAVDIAIPRLNEQNEIVRLINEAEKLGINYQSDLKKFRSLKAALMQDLLTGKVRVTTLLT